MSSPTFLYYYDVRDLSKVSCFSNTKIVRINTFPIQNFIPIYQKGQEFKGTTGVQPNIMSQDKSGQADRRQTCVLMNQATHVYPLYSLHTSPKAMKKTNMRAYAGKSHSRTVLR